MGIRPVIKISLVSLLLYCTPKHLAELRKPYELVGQEQRGDWMIDVFRNEQGNCSLHEYYVPGPLQDPLAEPLSTPSAEDTLEILEMYDCKEHNIYK